MKRLFYFVLICLGFVLISVSPGHSQINAGISIGDGGVRGFYLAVGNFYNVPERAVVAIHERRVPDEELPVVFFIAQRAGVKPAAVIELRSIGKSWLDITFHFGLSPEIFYVPVSIDPGPPYGRAYGHYKNHPRDKWKEVELSDADVVNLCNLRFVSKYYGIAPEEVIKLRGNGHSFVRINGEAKDIKAKEKEKEKAKASPAKHGGSDKGQGKGHGNNKHGGGGNAHADKDN